jgi:hypothetical protein
LQNQIDDGCLDYDDEEDNAQTSWFM